MGIQDYSINISDYARTILYGVTHTSSLWSIIYPEVLWINESYDTLHYIYKRLQSKMCTTLTRQNLQDILNSGIDKVDVILHKIHDITGYTI